jgi:tetratricopeptide (TPR) repeat protein
MGNAPPFISNFLNELFLSNSGSDEKASACLSAGQLMEFSNDYEAALECYTRAFSLEPGANSVWYFLHNNLGYCLNHFGRYVEAEVYCRQSIAIEGQRHNGYKNLGVALAGQSHYPAAARAYIIAVAVCPADPRALHALEQLFVEHPEVEDKIPDIFARIEECRKAVEDALGI